MQKLLQDFRQLYTTIQHITCFANTSYKTLHIFYNTIQNYTILYKILKKYYNNLKSIQDFSLGFECRDNLCISAYDNETQSCENILKQSNSLLSKNYSSPWEFIQESLVFLASGGIFSTFQLPNILNNRIVMETKSFVFKLLLLKDI